MCDELLQEFMSFVLANVVDAEEKEIMLNVMFHTTCSFARGFK